MSGIVPAWAASHAVYHPVNALACRVVTQGELGQMLAMDSTKALADELTLYGGSRQPHPGGGTAVS